MLAEFEVKMKRLMLYCDTLKIENNRLKKELSQKDNLIGNLHLEIDQFKEKYKNLKFAKSFDSQNEEERLIAKKRLSKLVRDVDKCISILKS